MIIQRHYLKEFFRVLLIIAAGLAIIFSLLDLIDKIDDFLPFRPPLEKLLFYVSFNFPKFLLYLLPMAILMCTLFVFSQADRRGEITAVRAAGGRIKTLLMPFLFAGIFLSFCGFVLGEFIVPEFSERSQEIKESIMKKGKKFSFKEGTVWLRATDGSIVKIGFYMPETKRAKDLSIFKTDKGVLTERIEAEEAEWIGDKDDSGKWKLKDVILYNMKTGKISRNEELEYPFMESPSFFARDIRKPEDMGIRELLMYTKRLEDAGFRNLKLTVDLNAKVSYPFINFFMVILGISLPLRGRTGGGLVTTAIGVAISLVYWFSHAMVLSLGYNGMLPPFVATWLVPLVFGVIAVIFFTRIPE